MVNRMPQMESSSILPKGRFTKLLILLLGMLVLAPLLDGFFHLRMLDDLFLTAVFIYATYSLSRDKRLLAAGICLALPAIVLTWWCMITETAWLSIAAGLCDMVFILTISVAILSYIFRQKQVSTDMIAGAIIVYLLMAVMWAQIFFVLELLRPGQFAFPAGNGTDIRPQLRYFSLVTITTVGYGDITPLSPGARAFANLEAVMGQLYLVIQVAWLVGMHVSVRSR